MQTAQRFLRFCAARSCVSDGSARGQRLFHGLVLTCLLVSACSPTFNWRALRDDGTPLQALMPCKPDSAQRDVPLGGALRSLQMHSCKAGGFTFAIGWAVVDEPTGLNEALLQWRAATLSTLGLNPLDLPAGQTATWVVPGAEQVQTLEAQGTSPAGQAVQVRAVYFGQGTRVYQAAVYGSGLSDDISAPFFEALRLP